MFSTLYQKIITTVLVLGTAVFTNIPGTDPEFSNGLIEQNGTQLVCSADLSNCWTPEFDRIIQSGQTIVINYRVELISETGILPQDTKNFRHELRYNVLDETFTVNLRESGTTRTLKNLAEVKTLITHIDRYAFSDVSDLKSNQTYFIRVSAGLNRITLPGMNEPFNLMNYWKNVRPTYLSEPFTKTDFSS